MKPLILCLALTGCATPRFFTDEEDAEAKKNCQAGCVVVPVDIWQQIVNRLRGAAI